MGKSTSIVFYYIPSLFFVAYPFLCDADEAVAILFLVCTAVVCAITAITVNKTFRITVADAVGGAAVLWIITTYFASSLGLISPSNIYEFAALCLVWFAIRNSQNLRQIMPFLLVGALLQVVVCGVQLVGITKSNHSFFPFTGSFINPGPLAGFLAATLFAFPYMWRRSGKIWLGVGVVATLTIIIWSGSRASWLAALAGALVCVLPWIIHQYSRLNPRKRILVGCIGILAIAISLAGLYSLKPASADGRLLIWKASVSLFAESPICGNGSGAFAREYLYHQADYLANKLMSGEALLADNVVSAFSEPVRILCEYGAVGFLIFGAFIVILFAGTYGSRSHRFILACFVAWLVFGLFSYPGGVYPLRLLFVVLAALLAKESRTCWSVRVKLPIKIVAIAGLAILLTAAAVNYIHSKRLEKVMTGLFSGKNESIPESLYKRFETEPQYLHSYGGLLIHEGKYDQATPVLEQAALIAPSSSLLSDLGKCYYEVGRTVEAEECLRTAVNMTPGYVTQAYELFNFYRREGRIADARQWAEYILSRKFKATNSASLFARKEAREYLDDSY
jgi:tetratricopeptide (TPR) repeat protein